MDMIEHLGPTRQTAFGPPGAAPPGMARWGSLAALLRERIIAGEWPPGHALAAESTLAADHDVALGTMRQALAQLAAEGLLERRHGKGTFVRGALAGAPMLRFFRFGDGAVGGEPRLPTSRILARRVRAAPSPVAQALRLAARQPALHLHRLRLLDGRPRLLEDIWLPLHRFAPLLDSEPSTWGDLLYPHYEAACGVTVHRATDEIRFGILKPNEARLLELPVSHPAAVVQRLASDIAGCAVECRFTRGDAHAFRYSVAIT